MSRVDPEVQSRDDGCFLHPHCLVCPEVICVYDYPGGVRGFFRAKVKEMLENGMTIEDLTVHFNIHKRTAEKMFNRASGR